MDSSADPSAVPPASASTPTPPAKAAGAAGPPGAPAAEDSAAEDGPAAVLTPGGCAPTPGVTAPNPAAPIPPIPPPGGPGYEATRQAIGAGAYPVYGAYGAYPPPPQAPPAGGYSNPNPYGFTGSSPYPGSSYPPPGGGYPPTGVAPPGGYGVPPPPPPPMKPGGGMFGAGGMFGESFFQHIDELRRRVFRCVVVLAIAAGIVSCFVKEINQYVLDPMQTQVEEMREPLLANLALRKEELRAEAQNKYQVLIEAAEKAGDGVRAQEYRELLARRFRNIDLSFEGRRYSILQMGQIRIAGPAGPFSYLVDLVMYGALLLAAPYCLWEAWGFLAPALYRREKIAVMPLFSFGLILFLAGSVFAYLYVLPTSFNYLMDLSLWLDIEPWYDLSDYFSFCFSVCLCFGLAFELPLLCIGLGKLGFLSVRTLIKYWKWFIFISFVVSAILTPPDVMSQFMMAGVLIVLYGISIVGVWIVYPRDNNS